MGPLYTWHIQTLFPRPIIYKQKENKYDLKCFATVTQNTRKCVKLIPQIELRKSFHKQLDKTSCGVPTVRADDNTITTNYRIEVSFNEKHLNVSNLLSFF